MIVLKDLSCGYGKKSVLTHVNVEIEQGNLTCLLGKNGVGKTTLFKTILGLIPSMDGEMEFNGQNLRSFSSRDFAKLISYVPQAHGSPFPFKVLDVVLMGQYIHTPGFFGKPSKKNIDFAVDCIEKLGIKKLIHKNFSKISGGEKQMVLIARAMAQKPAFIAMDEPTASLDMGNQVKVLKIAQMLKEKGYGVIMNTHSPEQALQYADKVILLKNRTVAKTGNPHEILQTQSITDLYNTPIELIETFISNGEKRKVLVTL